MIVGDCRDGAKRRLGCLCQATPHLCCVVFVVANEQVCVIAKDGACPTGVAALFDHAIECFSDRRAHCFVVPEDGMIEERVSFFVKFPQFLSRRLDALATVVDFSKLLQFFLSNLSRSTSTDLVGKPVAVPRENQMRRKCDATKVDR